MQRQWWHVRPWLMLLCGAALATALPLSAVSQGSSTWEVVPNWPEKPAARAAADYSYIDITGVAVGRDGRVYVCHGHPAKAKVVVFAADGTYLSSWKTDVLREPHTIRTAPDGNLWITDFYTNQVSKWSPEGELLALYGIRGRGRRDERHFMGPNDVAFAPNGDVYVAEGDGDRIVHLSADGRYLGSWGQRGRRPGMVFFPHSIATDAAGRVYLADRKNKRVQVFAADGTFLAQWKKVGTPYALFIDRQQRVYVADGKKGTIRTFTTSGQLLEKFGRWGRAPGRLQEPHGLCVDEAGNLYVADGYGKRVQKFVRR